MFDVLSLPLFFDQDIYLVPKLRFFASGIGGFFFKKKQLAWADLA